MKKILIAAVSFLTLSLVLTGCAKSSSTAKTAGTNDTNKPGRMRQPDFGQPDRAPDVRGLVKSVVGNEVTVLKIDMPAGGFQASSTSEQKSNTDKNSTRSAVSLTGSAGGRMMAGGPGGAGGPGEQTTESRAQMLAKLKELSTGEEKIIIPVGIQMLKMDTSDGKRTMVEATLADITADKNLTIWLSSGASAGNIASSTASTTAVTAERKIAEFVLIN
jgi:hypothetical protein